MIRHGCINPVPGCRNFPKLHWEGSINASSVFRYNDVILGAMASEITSPTTVYSNAYLGADQRKRQSSASLAYVRGNLRRPVNSPHRWPVTRKMFPLDDVIMHYDSVSEWCDSFRRDVHTGIHQGGTWSDYCLGIVSVWTDMIDHSVFLNNNPCCACGDTYWLNTLWRMAEVISLAGKPVINIQTPSRITKRDLFTGKIYGMRDIWLQILHYADRNRSWPRMPKQLAMLGNGVCVLQNSNITLRIWLTLNNGLILHAFLKFQFDSHIWKDLTLLKYYHSVLIAALFLNQICDTCARTRY